MRQSTYLSQKNETKVEVKCYPAYPIDWTLKSKVRFISEKSFSWCAPLKTNEESSGVTLHARTCGRQCDDEDQSRYQQVLVCHVMKNNFALKCYLSFAAVVCCIFVCIVGDNRRLFRCEKAPAEVLSPVVSSAHALVEDVSSLC